jgi:hypothetical protein
VYDRPDGARRLYAIDPGGVGELRRYFERFWPDALAAFKTAAERADD